MSLKKYRNTTGEKHKIRITEGYSGKVPLYAWKTVRPNEEIELLAAKAEQLGFVEVKEEPKKEAPKATVKKAVKKPAKKAEKPKPDAEPKGEDEAKAAEKPEEPAGEPEGAPEGAPAADEELSAPAEPENLKVYREELEAIDGIGEQYAKDIVQVYPYREALVDAVKSEGNLPFREDVDKLLREHFKG